jgi:Flp pilus assembly pilin Flp
MTIRELVRLVNDDSGQDLVEYGLLTGLVGAAALLSFLFLTGVLGFQYSTWLTGAYNSWEPCPPAPAVCP